MNINTLSASLNSGKLWVGGVVAAAAILAACGGGGGGSSGGGTGGAVSGPISGFGSIIVNGLRIDDSTADISVDDDDGSRSALKLGMIVHVSGQTDDSGNLRRADSISTSSYLQGPISAPPAADQFTVFGTTVTVNARTLYDGITGFADLAQGDVVEVHGMPNATGGITATRVEAKSTAEARLTGSAQNVTASEFQIGGITIQYLPGALHNLPGGITEGMLVRVKGTALNATTIDASRVRRARLTPSVHDRQELEIQGIVTRFASSNDFDVNGQAVTLASGAFVEGPFGLNSVVEVEGTVSNGILVAKEVKLEDDSQADEYEFHSAVAALDSAGKTFTMRSGTITVQWDNATVFDDSLPLGEANLANGLQVEVKARMSGGVLLATRIKRDD